MTWIFENSRVREGDILTHIHEKGHDGVVSDDRPRIMRNGEWQVATEADVELAWKEVREYKAASPDCRMIYSGRLINIWDDDCPQYTTDGRNPPILDENVIVYYMRTNQLKKL